MKNQKSVNIYDSISKNLHGFDKVTAAAMALSISKKEDMKKSRDINGNPFVKSHCFKVKTCYAMDSDWFIGAVMDSKNVLEGGSGDKLSEEFFNIVLERVDINDGISSELAEGLSRITEAKTKAEKIELIGLLLNVKGGITEDTLFGMLVNKNLDHTGKISNDVKKVNKALEILDAINVIKKKASAETSSETVKELREEQRRLMRIALESINKNTKIRK